jgi:4,5-dihydroxyphthalate decarboxylase
VNIQSPQGADPSRIAPQSRSPQIIVHGGTACLNLTLAVCNYEHVREVTSGAIGVDGIVLTPLVFPSIEEITFRFTRNLEWDVSELSFGKYTSLTSQGNAPMIAIPVFPSRVHRHSAIYVRGDRGIRVPKDLKLPSGIRYQARPDASLSAMLESGEIDAAITARPPLAFAQSAGQIVRLFPDYRAEEERLFRATGVFPIMHLITIRRAVFEQYPWVAMNLFKAFEESKRRCFERLRDFTLARIPLPWAAAIANEIAASYGPDPYPYGVEASRPTIEAFCRYAHQQGVTHRLMTPEDLFPPEVRAIAKV